MASYTVARAKHATLTTTTADLLTMGAAAGPRLRELEVLNRSTSVDLYFTWASGGSATTAVSAATDTTIVLPGQAVTVDLTDSVISLLSVSVVGNANAYSVQVFV